MILPILFSLQIYRFKILYESWSKMQPNDIQIGTTLKNIRQNRHISKKTLAKSLNCTQAELTQIESNQKSLSAENLYNICLAMLITPFDIYREHNTTINNIRPILQASRHAYETPLTNKNLRKQINLCQKYLQANPDATLIKWLKHLHQAQLYCLEKKAIPNPLQKKADAVSKFYLERDTWLPIDTIVVRTLVRIPGYYRHLPQLEETILLFSSSEQLGYYELAPIHMDIGLQLIEQQKQLNAQFTIEKAWKAAKMAQRIDIYNQASEILTTQFQLPNFSQDILA